MELRAEFAGLMLLAALPLYSQPGPANAAAQAGSVRVRFTSAHRGATLPFASPRAGGLHGQSFPVGLGLSAGFATSNLLSDTPIHTGRGFRRHGFKRHAFRPDFFTPFFFADQVGSSAVLVVPQPVWVEAPASPTAEAAQSAVRTPSGPRIQDSPYYHVGGPASEWLHPLLGMSAEEVNGQMATDLGIPGGRGVVIRQIAPGSPAEKADLQPGDIILCVDGKPVRTLAELRTRLRESLDPKNIPVSLLRGGFQMSVILQVD